MKTLYCLCLCLFTLNAFAQTYNVKDYGATGKKEGSAQAAIQKTIDACAGGGGGMVYIPAGQYSSGTIHLKSNVRFYLEAGATLYSIKDSAAFDKPTLLYAEDAHNITIEGRGTIEGQAEYDWKVNDYYGDAFIRPNLEAEQLTSYKPMMRSFPKKNQYGHLIFLLNCKDVRIADLSLLNSPSWTLRPVHCERLVIDGVYIHTDTKLGVWADGIDPDGCKDVHINNCTVITGDDALVFYSMDWYGPAQPCENITVTNCRFTSASSAIKFCDGNRNCIRHVTIDNCVVEGANRGIAFMDFDKGYVEDIVLSNLTINCIRYDWFWWGDGDPIHFNIKKRNEIGQDDESKNVPAGKISHVVITNVIAVGKGSSICNGHPESWLQDITLNNVKLYIAHDTTAHYDKSVYAIKFQYVKNLKLKNVDIYWGTPGFAKWTGALDIEDVDGLELNDVTATQAKQGSDIAAISFARVMNASIKNCSPQAGTGTFFHFGEKTKNITLFSNDFTNCKTPFTADDKAAVRSEMNVNPK